MEYSVIIVAAGSGSRMKLGYNKVYYRGKDGRTILEHTMDLFLKDQDCRQIVVVTDPEVYRHEMTGSLAGKVVLAKGGATRQESVSSGLKAVISDYVMVHDGARPFLDESSLNALKQALSEVDAACLLVRVKDTIKVVQDGYVVSTPERDTLYAALTPQAFKTQLLISCMEQAQQEGFTGTDDSSLVERYSDVKVKAVEGSYANRKITTPEDL
ncbi:MAG: 2-C-methyl-D-erythritol 4-phosphate cytidylyltransferase [Solobacterium sp.]|nr:2-C-methyl-D-erythritol 4-phosphate cytidylyltransferase [Solobacterium sp.]MCH4222806.1 2-C-methyl-D-erythritol 4-phosphate cytidylyltransferase [Solobacterium sp.]MCH4265426.1 2-C-methyl-D-erythritol 4-phosphate cytidylyltransferase [Solobacterium sp.]